MDLIDEGRVIAAVLDRGYFSLENLVRCKDAGYKVLIAAKMDVSWVKEAAEEVMSDLWDARTRLRGCTAWGKTVQKEIKFNDGKMRTLWVHIFRDEMSSHVASQQLFSEIESFENQWKAADYAKAQTREALSQSQTLKYFMKPKGAREHAVSSAITMPSTLQLATSASLPASVRCPAMRRQPLRPITIATT